MLHLVKNQSLNFPITKINNYPNMDQLININRILIPKTWRKIPLINPEYPIIQISNHIINKLDLILKLKPRNKTNIKDLHFMIWLIRIFWDKAHKDLRDLKVNHLSIYQILSVSTIKFNIIKLSQRIIDQVIKYNLC